MKIKLDHVGFVTNNPEKFEKFWVGILGFKRIWESKLTPEICKFLFDIDYGVLCRRYEKDDMVIEIHCFDKPVIESSKQFNRFGLNHICLFVDDRREFLKQYNLKAKIYDNPRGHKNIFLQDFEGNWIELKEKL